MDALSIMHKKKPLDDAALCYQQTPLIIFGATTTVAFTVSSRRPNVRLPGMRRASIGPGGHGDRKSSGLQHPVGRPPAADFGARTPAFEGELPDSMAHKVKINDESSEAVPPIPPSQNEGVTTSVIEIPDATAR